ncbi:hypothetical protein FACS189419_09530 [Planctomycetales bacterium]|nr:hypothetical protein FACS189419_09530 [Planctomycetales bacterium]
MAWYYYDNADTKQGPFTDEQIEELIEKRAIVQQTRLETGAGQQGLAEQIHQFKQKFDLLLPKNTQDSERITISLPTKKEIIDATKNISGKAKEQSGKFLKEHSPSFAAYRAYRGDRQIVIYLCGVALIGVFLFCYGIIAALGILLLGIVGAGVDYLIFVNTLPAEMQGIIKDAREKELGYPEIKTAIQQYYYEQGERSVSQEEYKKAIESYEKAVKFGLTEAQHKLDDANMKLQNKLADGNMGIAYSVMIYYNKIPPVEIGSCSKCIDAAFFSRELHEFSLIMFV